MSRESKPDFARLVPDIANWNAGAGIDVKSWTVFNGSVELAIGYSQLFWFDFVQHDGCVLRAGFEVAAYDEWMAACAGDREQVERVANHTHVADHFARFEEAATHEQLVYLGRTLLDMWQAKLARDFPGKRFGFDWDEGPFEDRSEYQLTFWQVRK